MSVAIPGVLRPQQAGRVAGGRARSIAESVDRLEELDREMTELRKLTDRLVGVLEKLSVRLDRLEQAQR